MTELQLFEGVCACIRATLNKELPEIKESDRLIGDLGADSLDFLDLIFHLERKFAVRVNPRDLERRTQQALGEVPMVVDARYTAEAVAAFAAAMPEVPAGELVPNMPVQLLPHSFRVRTFMNLVEHMRHEGAGQ